jgi:hypothetical protein
MLDDRGDDDVGRLQAEAVREVLIASVVLRQMIATSSVPERPANVRIASRASSYAAVMSCDL